METWKHTGIGNNALCNLWNTAADFVLCSGFKAGAFGGVAFFALIFYASGIPRVQKDILQRIPGLSGYYIKEIPASDNPF
jgi:hypothetical protein